MNDFSCVIIINNIPKTSKVEGLKKKKVLTKLLEQFGPVDRLEVPTKTKDGKEKTLGFALEYHTQLAAKKATEKLHKYKLDKKHQFLVTTFNDARKVLEMRTITWNLRRTHFRKSKGRFKIDPSQNLQHWLSDKFQRDQFVVRFGKETLVSWVENSVAPPTKEYDGAEVKAKGKSWCERYVAWSRKVHILRPFINKVLQFGVVRIGRS